MLCVVGILVTMHYLVWDMRIIWWRLPLLKSWHKGKAYLYSTQKGGSTLIPSRMNIYDGNLMDFTAHSFCTTCFCMLWPPRGKDMTEPSVGAGDSPWLSEIWEQRSPGKSPCDAEMEERIHQGILDSITEHLWQRLEHAQLEERPRWSPASASRPDPWAKFQDRVCTTYGHFRDLKEGSCEEALAIAWDVHRWVLAAVALLEDKIERLSHSLSYGC